MLRVTNLLVCLLLQHSRICNANVTGNLKMGKSFLLMRNTEKCPYPLYGHIYIFKLRVYRQIDCEIFIDSHCLWYIKSTSSCWILLDIDFPLHFWEYIPFQNTSSHNIFNYTMVFLYYYCRFYYLLIATEY